MVYGLILMALATHKAAEFWRMSVGFKGFTLITVLIRDQVIYFSLCVASLTLFYKINDNFQRPCMLHIEHFGL